MDSKDLIWNLIGRSLSGELSAEDESDLQQLLADNPEIEQQFRMLKKLWAKKHISHSLSERQVEKSRFNNILSRAEIEREADNVSSASNRKFSIFYSTPALLAYAATIAILFVLYISFPGAGKVQEADKPGQLIAAQNGSRSKVLLPDGSTVWLNGGSKLHYDFEASETLREVILEGEAFFDVAKDKSRPFIVHAGKIDIKVHGTAFNVKCYKEDKNIETTLIHGKIEVSDTEDASKPHVFLSANEKLIVPAGEQIRKSHSVGGFDLVKLDAKVKERERLETAWIYNRIEFRGENFEDLARKLERWYNVEIDFDDASVKLLTFNGSFERETVNEAFAALGRVASFRYEINGRKILIKSYE